MRIPPHHSSIRLVLLFIFLTLFALPAAQAQLPKGDLFFGYSRTGSDVFYPNVGGLNGWHAAGSLKVAPFISADADVAHYGLGAESAVPRTTTYLFGPRVTVGAMGFRVFAHGLIGGNTLPTVAAPRTSPRTRSPMPSAAGLTSPSPHSSAGAFLSTASMPPQSRLPAAPTFASQQASSSTSDRSTQLRPGKPAGRNFRPPCVMAVAARFCCPCCGSRTLETPAARCLCSVWRWEHDGQDDSDAFDARLTVNGQLSLHEARKHYVRCGAAHPSFLPYVCKPDASER